MLPTSDFVGADHVVYVEGHHASTVCTLERGVSPPPLQRAVRRRCVCTCLGPAAAGRPAAVGRDAAAVRCRAVTSIITVRRQSVLQATVRCRPCAVTPCPVMTVRHHAAMQNMCSGIANCRAGELLYMCCAGLNTSSLALLASCCVHTLDCQLLVGHAVVCKSWPSTATNAACRCSAEWRTEASLASDTGAAAN